MLRLSIFCSFVFCGSVCGLAQAQRIVPPPPAFTCPAGQTVMRGPQGPYCYAGKVVGPPPGRKFGDPNNGIVVAPPGSKTPAVNDPSKSAVPASSFGTEEPNSRPEPPFWKTAAGLTAIAAVIGAIATLLAVFRRK